MKTMRMSLWCVGLGLLAIACAHEAVSYSPLVDLRMPSKGTEAVEVFITTKPAIPYVELGILSYLTYLYDPDDRVVIGLLRKKAAAIGADAIIILDTRTEVATNYVTKQSYQGKIFRAMAIAYRRPE